MGTAFKYEVNYADNLFLLCITFFFAVKVLTSSCPEHSLMYCPWADVQRKFVIS